MLVARHLGALRFDAIGITSMQSCVVHRDDGIGGELVKGFLKLGAQHTSGRDTDSEEDVDGQEEGDGCLARL